MNIWWHTHDDDVIYLLFIHWQAYKKLALKHHPDKQTGKSDEEKAASETQFRAVSEAYEVLSDRERRQRYDQGREIMNITYHNEHKMNTEYLVCEAWLI